MDYFTSDWYLNSKYVHVDNNRPFYHFEEMNNCLIENCNRDVKSSDRLFFLGNFLYGNRNDEFYLRGLKHFRSKIKCRNLFLIMGNCDRRGRRYDEFREFFSVTLDYSEVLINDISFVLCHYPIVDTYWNRYKRGSYQLHGHSMGQLDNWGTKRFDVGVDNVAKIRQKKGLTPQDLKSLYSPISSDEILNYLTK